MPSSYTPTTSSDQSLSFDSSSPTSTSRTADTSNSTSAPSTSSPMVATPREKESESSDSVQVQNPNSSSSSGIDSPRDKEFRGKPSTRSSSSSKHQNLTVQQTSPDTQPPLSPSQIPVESTTSSAVEQAIALGLTRDQYEQTRAQIVDMLRGKKSNATSQTGAQDDVDATKAAASLLLDASVTSTTSSLPRLNVSSRKSSNRSTVLSDSAPPSTSTLRTSVSSSTQDDLFSPTNQGSPPTSDEDVANTQRTRKHRHLLDQPLEIKERSSLNLDIAEEGDSSGKSREEGDSSFNAANAAAAALGMLASSPVKVLPPRQNDYNEHRSRNLSSSPQLNPSSSFYDQPSSSAGYLPTSPTQQHNGKGKSTTPVRTRLEDIALKSSAQIRRRRERLGLGDQEEMMDLDTDARHESEIMRHLSHDNLHVDVDHEGMDEDDEDDEMDRSLQGLAPGFSGHPNSSLTMDTTAPRGHSRSPSRNGSPQRQGRGSGGPPSSPYSSANGHRRGPSYDSSRGRGMLDRFMETSSPPKIPQTARFNDARGGDSSRRGSERGYDSERTIRDDDHEDVPERPQKIKFKHKYEAEDDGGARSRLEDEDEEDDFHIPPVQSTPRQLHSRRTALMRSAGNDLPSPLLQQIRMISDADYSPLRDEDDVHQSPRYRTNGHGGLGIPSSAGHGSSSDASNMGSARKRKASYDLKSPRQRVVNYEVSPPPSMSPPQTSSPPLFPAFATSSPRFHSANRGSAVHPSSSGHGLFDRGHQTPTKQSLSQSQPASLTGSSRKAKGGQLYPYPNRDGDFGGMSLQSSQESNANAYDYSTRATSVGSDFGGQAQETQQSRQTSQYYSHEQLMPPSSGKKSKAKKRTGSLTPSLGADQDVQRGWEQHSSRPPSSSSATPSTTFTQTPVPIGQYDAKTKPPFSYAALIGQAIFSTPNHRMSLADIYTYIMTIYPFYKKTDAGWQNSIRHNLSLNECFVKTQRAPDEPGKGCLWSVQPGTEEQFTGGNFYKKGKIPKSASKTSVNGSMTSSKGAKKKSGGASGADTGSVVSAGDGDDSFDNMSLNSSSFVSASASMRQQRSQTHPDPRHLYADQRSYSNNSITRPPHPSSRASYNSQHLDEQEEDVYEEEADSSLDMDEQHEENLRRQQQMLHEQQIQQQQAVEQARWLRLHKDQQEEQEQKSVLSSSKGAGRGQKTAQASQLRHSISQQEEWTDGDESYQEDSGFEPSKSRGAVDERDQDYHAATDARHGKVTALTSPIRRHGRAPSRRALLTSPPIMSSPPTNVFARMSQPYQPLRDAFNIPGQSNNHAAALMSSPPPAGIMPSDARARRLPPPTPRSAARDEEHAMHGSSIFLPAPNIKPGRSGFSRRGVDDDEDDVDKPVLPPIQMMSPASALVSVNTQSPVSSIRGSAANRSTSPSPKSSTQSSSSSSQRSPTLNKARLLHSAEVFKTPDRFSTNSSRIASPNKLAQLASNNASKALQSLQYNSTPKLPGSRGMHGLVTPGGYYDPYEYGAALDEELERMAKNGESDGSSSRHGDRRALPFPSPLDRTPKWQPWSPW